MLIAPSLLSCNFSVFRDEIIRVDNAGADIMHLDVMDGHLSRISPSARLLSKSSGRLPKSPLTYT